MDVLLVNPPQIQGIKGIYPNLGLGYIASYIENQGVDAGLIDLAANKEVEALENTLESDKPMVVGISSNSFNFLYAKEIAKKVKKINQNILTVIGGPQASLFPKDILNNPEFDIATVGEGEKSFFNLLNNLSNFSNVRGIAFREGREIIINPPEAPIEDLNGIPFPARNLMPMENYFSPMASGQTYHIMITSRGCPFSCTYCAPIEGKKFRSRKPENIADEIEELVSEFGIKFIQFYDDSFSVNKNNILGLCDEIKERGIDFQWDARTRVDIVDKELLSKMKGAGCVRIRYGVESGDSEILDSMNKKISLKQVKSAVEITNQIGGIETLSYFMIGFPGDTLESIMRTINFARELNTDHVRFNITTANPGTKLYQDALNSGRFNGDPWKLYSQGNLGTVPNLIFESEEYNRKDLEKLVRHAYQVCNQ